MKSLGLLFGGASLEHEISIITAYQLKRKLEKEYEIHLIYGTAEGTFYNADRLALNDFKHSQFKKLKKLNLKKWKLSAIVGAMHGENGEDGLGVAFARLHHIKYLGCDMFASSLCLDKYKSYLFLSKNDILMVDTTYYTYEDYLNNKKVITPCIIKPVRGGSSLGIEVVREDVELASKLNDAFKFSKELIIQPYYSDLVEYNLALNETDFSNLEKIHKKSDIFSFENKYSDAFKVMHQSLVSDKRYEEFCQIARKVYQLIGASGIIRIDFFMIEDRIYVNEVNTTPGALAMYLFPNFPSTFKTSLSLCLLKEDKVYQRGNFLLKNNIDK